MTQAEYISIEEGEIITDVDRLSMRIYEKNLEINNLRHELDELKKQREQKLNFLKNDYHSAHKFLTDEEIAEDCRSRADQAKSVAQKIRVVLRENSDEEELTTDDIEHAISIRWPQQKKITRENLRRQLDKMANGKEAEIEKTETGWWIPDCQAHGRYFEQIPSPRRAEHKRLREERNARKHPAQNS